MVPMNIPGEIMGFCGGGPKPPLKVIIEVGTLGFKRTEIMKEWRAGQQIWVDPEAVSVIFEIFPKSCKKMVPKSTF